MKRLILAAIIICLCFVSLFGCKTNKPFHTVLYAEYENDSIYEQKEDARSYDFIDYIDQTAPTKRQLDLFGNLYNLTYSTSTRRACSDLFVHVYQLDEVEGATVQFDAQTGEVVKYSGIPLTHSMTEEQQYIDFISDLLEGRYDLSDYQYSCTTHYNKFYDEDYGDERPGMDSKTVKGFRIVDENEHEKLFCYIFYYSKPIAGYKTNEHIAVQIDEDSINLEIYDFGYAEADFSEFLKSIKTINDQVDGYLRTDTKERYTISGVEIESHRLFLYNGKPHVITTSTISYSRNDSSDETYSTMVETITGGM
ncbi:MAG: hypothetical protein IJX76_05590 [Clostridia bacterium]|nr:hypothetical protein [Clostridia bacterium]